MKDQYIIVNKTAIESKITELEEAYFINKGKNIADEGYFDGARTYLKILLSQSTPLIPEIEKVLEIRKQYYSSTDESIIKKYISNLKLDI